MSKTHKVFVSYHHADEPYRKKFDALCEQFGTTVNRSVQLGDIEDQNRSHKAILEEIKDRFIGDATVTVVLIGEETWSRKFVDWEIEASLVHHKHNPRNGLIGILLPTHPDYHKLSHNERTLPPRLVDNLHNKFATLHRWQGDYNQVKDWIHQAFKRRNEKAANNSREPFARNQRGKHWT